MITRRALLALLAGTAAADAFGQGVSSRAVKPMPRGKPSGLPFHARFTDVARAAGLTHVAGSTGNTSEQAVKARLGHVEPPQHTNWPRLYHGPGAAHGV